MNAERYEIHELMIARIAEEMTAEGEHIVLMGSFTPLAYAAYMLGKLTHARDAWLAGYNAVGIDPVELSFTGSEAAAYRSATSTASFNQNGWLFHLGKRGLLECVSSAQIGADGAINLSTIGPYDSPKVRLPGGAGAPEVVQNYRRMVAYFTRHDRRTLVPEVDFATGRRTPIGAAARQAQDLCPGAILIVTPLAVLCKDDDERPFRLESIHPGVDVETVVENTGFELEVDGTPPTTAAPTAEQVTLLRERIDPFRTARFDFLTGEERLDYLEDLLAREWARAEALVEAAVR
jgi:acyl CoA:acetate/3-ketoacid CoA transferase beta subunit